MLEEGNTLIQVVVGPRQTGKSTMIAQALRGLDVLAHSVSADDILAPTEEWLRDERQQARNLQRMSHSPLVLGSSPGGPTRKHQASGLLLLAFLLLLGQIGRKTQNRPRSFRSCGPNHAFEA